MKFKDFVIPDTLDQALQVLGELGDSGMPVSGLTAFQYLPDFPETTAVDITRIGLDTLTRENGQFHVGAATTLRALAEYKGDGWVLGEVASRIPTQQIRNISTIGGGIGRVFPWSEMPLALLVLDATILVRGSGDQSLPAAEFFENQPATVLRGGKLITEVVVPAVKSDEGFGYVKYNVTNAAFSLMSAAVWVKRSGEQIGDVRIAVGGGVPDPYRYYALEECIKECGNVGEESTATIREVVSKSEWIGRQGYSDAYAANIAAVAIADALDKAFSGKTEGM